MGGLAAAVCAHFWEQLGERRPRFIVVEPDKAACLYESARAGVPVAVHGDLDTVMAGLACGEVSLLAWEVLHPGAQAFLTVDDEAALQTVRLLASGRYGEAGRGRRVGGRGLTGCLAALADPALRDALGLDADSRVLVFSEGATDPELYQRIVGRSAGRRRSRGVTGASGAMGGGAARINAPRLLGRIAELAQVGAIEGGGVCRLALTEADRQGRDLVVRWMREAGLAVTIDGIGNVVGVRAGQQDGPPVMTGSHIDTVRTGGRYDGNLGVLAGLEVIAALNDAGVVTRRPVAVAFFTNEEGARFAPT